jgi:hypothetical protein
MRSRFARPDDFLSREWRSRHDSSRDGKPLSDTLVENRGGRKSRIRKERDNAGRYCPAIPLSPLRDTIMPGESGPSIAPLRPATVFNAANIVPQLYLGLNESTRGKKRKINKERDCFVI